MMMMYELKEVGNPKYDVFRWKDLIPLPPLLTPPNPILSVLTPYPAHKTGPLPVLSFLAGYSNLHH